jgi:hypothetical protein
MMPTTYSKFWKTPSGYLQGEIYLKFYVLHQGVTTYNQTIVHVKMNVTETFKDIQTGEIDFYGTWNIIYNYAAVNDAIQPCYVYSGGGHVWGMGTMSWPMYPVGNPKSISFPQVTTCDYNGGLRISGNILKIPYEDSNWFN